MPNNINAINEELNRQMAETVGSEIFDDKNITFTEEEKARMAEISKEQEVVVKNVTADGTVVNEVPIETYAQSLDERLKKIMDEEGNVIAKGINVGDIKETTEGMKAAARDRAIKTFRQLAKVSTDGNYTDDEIVNINDSAITSMLETMGVEKLDSDEVRKFYRKMSFQEIVATLPPDFVKIYTNEDEVKANNIVGKNRLLAALEFMCTTGPELDYLNDYIETESRMMTVSRRLMQCQVDFTNMLKSQEKLSEFVARVEQIAPPVTDEVWKNCTNPKTLHNEFAQRIVMHEHLIDAYRELNLEYQDDARATEMITEQIDESNYKIQVYQRIMDLRAMKDLYIILQNRMRNDRRNSYQNLEREAYEALDRIRRAKQNVHFPVYDPQYAKNPKALYNLYITQYPIVLAQYNRTIRSVKEKGEQEVSAIELEGIPEETVLHYFSLIVLILFGRIMKKFSKHDATKYDAIELDAYFLCYCKLAGDAFLMTDVWNLLKDFVQYAIVTWPQSTNKKKKGKK